jgi:O-antigen/teichoic acid export membrane protein
MTNLRARIARLLTVNRRFINAVVVYGVGQVGQKGLDVVAFALLVSALTSDQLGFVGAVLLFGYVMTEVLTLGLFRIAVPRMAMDGPEARERVLRTALGAYMAYFAIGGFALLLTPSQALHALGLGDFNLPFRVYGLAFLLRAFATMQLELLRMDHRPGLQSLLEASLSLVNLGALAILLPLLPDNVLASACAMCLSWAAPAAYFFTRELRRRRPSLAGLGDLLRYSAPIALHQTLADINALASRWIVVITLGLSAAGVFTFFMRIGDIVKLGQQPLVKAWMPTMISAASDTNSKRKSAPAMLFMLLGTTLFVVALPACRYIARLIDQSGKFSDSYNSIPVVLFAGWILLFYHIFGVGYLFGKRTIALVPITAITATTNIAVSIFLVQRHGVLLVPYANVVSNSVFVILTSIFGYRYFKYDSPKLMIVTAICFTLGISAFLLDRLMLS